MSYQVIGSSGRAIGLQTHSGHQSSQFEVSLHSRSIHNNLDKFGGRSVCRCGSVSAVELKRTRISERMTTGRDNRDMGVMFRAQCNVGHERKEVEIQEERTGIPIQGHNVWWYVVARFSVGDYGKTKGRTRGGLIKAETASRWCHPLLQTNPRGLYTRQRA